MKIALFGGAFDPPHIGHKIVADSLIANNIVDAVWFVPVFKHPWADRFNKIQLADYHKRVEMLRLTIAATPTSEKQKIVHYKSVSFVYDTLEYFSKKHPEHDFSWVMGSEYLARFDDFLLGHPGLLNYHFYIYPRAGHRLDEQLKKPNMTFLYDMPEVTASSTQIKKLVKEQKAISDLVVSKVEQVIMEEGLYR